MEVVAQAQIHSRMNQTYCAAISNSYVTVQLLISYRQTFEINDGMYLG